MKQTTLALLLGLGLMVLCGCVGPRSEFSPPPGGLFSSYKAPLLIDYDKANVSRESGNASTEYFCMPFTYGLLNFAWDDCSLNTAAENGRFNKVGTADYEFLNILGIYAKTTVHVYQAQPDK